MLTTKSTGPKVFSMRWFNISVCVVLSSVCRLIGILDLESWNLIISLVLACNYLLSASKISSLLFKRFSFSCSFYLSVFKFFSSFLLVISCSSTVSARSSTSRRSCWIIPTYFRFSDSRSVMSCSYTAGHSLVYYIFARHSLFSWTSYHLDASSSSVCTTSFIFWIKVAIAISSCCISGWSNPKIAIISLFKYL